MTAVSQPQTLGLIVDDCLALSHHMDWVNSCNGLAAVALWTLLLAYLKLLLSLSWAASSVMYSRRYQCQGGVVSVIVVAELWYNLLCVAVSRQAVTVTRMEIKLRRRACRVAMSRHWLLVMKVTVLPTRRCCLSAKVHSAVCGWRDGELTSSWWVLCLHGTTKMGMI